MPAKPNRGSLHRQRKKAQIKRLLNIIGQNEDGIVGLRVAKSRLGAKKVAIVASAFPNAAVHEQKAMRAIQRAHQKVATQHYELIPISIHFVLHPPKGKRGASFLVRDWISGLTIDEFQSLQSQNRLPIAFSSITREQLFDAFNELYHNIKKICTRFKLEHDLATSNVFVLGLNKKTRKIKLALIDQGKSLSH